MAPSAIDETTLVVPDNKRPPERIYPPAKIFPVREARFEDPIPIHEDGRQKALAQPTGGAVIVIDNGSSNVRAGWSFDAAPRFSIPPIMAKYRDRKLGKTYSFAGSDCYADTTAKGHLRYAFEAGSGIVSSWDVMEHVLDYTFLKLGLNGVDGAIDMPIVMTEAVANLPYSRKTMTEIIFECYGAPSLTYGIDSLFSYNYNGGKTGLVVSSSYTSTHVIPVYNSKAMLAQATRLNWGGWHASEYLLKLIRLKYPSFAGKLNHSQAEHMLRDYGYISTDYNQELKTYLDWTGLEDRDIVIQYPFTEEIIVQKSQEELDHEAALERIIKELDKAVRKGRMKDVGGDEEEAEVPVFDLVDVPDEELDDLGIKAKKQQRLAKANYDARQRAKAEKEAEKARIVEEKRLDEERREKDLEGWLGERHEARAVTLQKMKEKERMKQDLGNRKSLASQIRMKSLANLASDNPTKKRRRGGDDDTFGADDDDWGVYRDIADNASDEEEEDLVGKLTTLEQDLLIRTGATELNQIHLNVERIRVPEVIFQPSIAGVDQAGLVEIAGDILNQRLAGIPNRDDFLRDIFLTGGNTLFNNFDARLRAELMALLPAGAPLTIRPAKDAVLDAWRGAAQWAGSSSWKAAAVSRQEYEEKGSEYFKEHNLGNAFVQ
ncbi:unnamed protein product [Parascedosporium putredinis]|uniref:Uncharacterized protein n=1 Tax=Parascedosporium putredinis TaxID=1442378 RepID=A0A9P1GUJ1_9PEZI|nr:unnamed protein product [Parascedosporium putredinis]CAI7987647.1 unnamed protein product [Parascedosporium putredinis]